MTMPEGLERALPENVGRDMFDALVIRTDFSDDESWNAVVGELRRRTGKPVSFPQGCRLSMCLLGREQRLMRFLPQWTQTRI